MNRRTIVKGIVITAVIVLLIVCALAALLFFSGNRVTVARCIVTESGSLYMVYEDRPVQLNYEGDVDCKTGDKLFIVHSTAFAESWPEQTRAVLVIRLSRGDESDVPDNAFDIFSETESGEDADKIQEISSGLDVDGSKEMPSRIIGVKCASFNPLEEKLVVTAYMGDRTDYTKPYSPKYGTDNYAVFMVYSCSSANYNGYEPSSILINSTSDKYEKAFSEADIDILKIEFPCILDDKSHIEYTELDFSKCKTGETGTVAFVFGWYNPYNDSPDKMTEGQRKFLSYYVAEDGVYFSFNGEFYAKKAAEKVNNETDVVVLFEDLPPDTDLEFWITEDVAGYEWLGHDQIYGIFGGREYLGTGYKKTPTETGTGGHPEYYVLYTVGAYPDLSDGGKYVKTITVTDPNVRVYGLTIKSTYGEFDKVFSELGYNLRWSDGAIDVRIATKGNITVSFKRSDYEKGVKAELRIRAAATNKYGIMY